MKVIRKIVPGFDDDRMLSGDIERLADAVREGKLGLL